MKERGDKALGLDDAVCRAMCSPALGYTAVHKDERIGSAGVFQVWPGVGEAWSFFTPEIRNHPFFLHRIALKMLPLIIEAGGFHRIYCNIWSEFGDALRWAERLGFCSEGLMRKFTPDQRDYYRYAKVL
jgi:RimJ/RimL family protein N-acetyltransferase